MYCFILQNIYALYSQEFTLYFFNVISIIIIMILKFTLLRGWDADVVLSVLAFFFYLMCFSLSHI